jgi:hypothetical protein
MWQRLKRARAQSTLLLVTATPLALASMGVHTAVLPPEPGMRGERTALQATIEAQPMCIGSAVMSAGKLSDVLYYRAVALDSEHVAVGYFAFFSEERPWGNNWLTWSFFPAFAVDLVYSRALFVAPGVQRALYGAGDIEGVGVVYHVEPDGSFTFDHAMADDDKERTVVIPREQAFAVDKARPTFYSQVWSHQLGGNRAHSAQDLSYVRCYGEGSVRPLPDSLARAFRLDDRDRAPPAHVERLAEERLDLPPAVAQTQGETPAKRD